MHVMPTIGVEKCTFPSALQLESRVRSDMARNLVVNGMTKLQSVKTQVIKQPRTQCGYCTRRRSSTAGLGGDPNMQLRRLRREDR